uniref:Uncharacterized protein n=1 Tax=Anguilla anguilla TaxID=7936 RepID=A0A0E9UZG7_ANGAN
MLANTTLYILRHGVCYYTCKYTRSYMNQRSAQVCHSLQTRIKNEEKKEIKRYKYI